jgi:ferredoxin
MANFEDRVAQNAPGKFYVDWSCLYCGLCDEMAPSVFREHKERGWAFVFSQPMTPNDLRLAREAAEACPTESIGTDGDQHSWSSQESRTKTDPVRDNHRGNTEQ